MVKISDAILYVYAYSWTPGFCYNQNYPGCLAPQEYWKTNFTIHGLWPQYSDSSYSEDGYPSYCSSEAFDPSIINEIGYNTMTEKWPNVQSSETDTDYDSFWDHEWSKHGTCSGLSQLDYFDAALNLTEIITTPDVLQQAIGQNMSAESLRDAMDNGVADSAVLQCDKTQDDGYVLTGVYTCWDQQDGFPTVQVVCPDKVVKEDTCYSDMIAILDLS